MYGEKIEKEVKTFDETFDAPDDGDSLDPLESFDEIGEDAEGDESFDDVDDIEDEDEDASEDTTSDEEPEESDEADEEAEEIARIKAEDGTELPENLTFEKKVDGKMEKVDLKTLLDSYSGKIAIKARFDEANTLKQKADHQQKVIEKEKESLVNTITDFNNCVKKGWFRDAITSLCKLTGEDAEQAWQNFTQMQEQNLNNIQQLTPEQLEQQRIKDDAEYWQRQAQKQQENQVDTQEVERAKQAIEQAKQQHGLEDADLQWAYNTLIDMQSKGEYNGEVNVDSVVEVANDRRIWQSIDEVVSAYIPEKRGDAGLYSEVLADTKKHNISLEAWQKFLKDFNSQSTNKTTKKKAKKQAQKNLVKRGSSSSSKAPLPSEDIAEEEGLTLDDL